MVEEVVELAPYQKWLGKPNFTASGIPIYTFDELCFDATVHLLSLVWVGISSQYLLQLTRDWNIIIYILCTSLLFCTSAAYNIIACGWHYKSELLRKLDHAAIFLYIAGCYTAILKPSLMLAVIWFICITVAIGKLWLGRKIEIPSIIILLLLILLPLFVYWNSSYCREIMIMIGLMIIGFSFYINNILKGSMALWHICVLLTTIVFWRIVYLHVKNKEVCE